MAEQWQPYVSIVVSGRNDNYGGDFNSRLAASLNWIYTNANKYKIETEVVFVNYNPLEDKPSLPEMMDWPQGTDYFKTLFITVPNAVHKKFINPEVRKTLPLFEFIAKNAGIRRANGQYILTINADILLSEEVFKELAKRELRNDTIYRTNRCDFHPVEMSGDIAKDREKIQDKVFKVFLSGGGLHFKYQGDFEKQYADVVKKAKRSLKLKRLVSDVFRITGDNFLSREYYRVEWYGHCDACGDFLLMDKKHWMKLRGFYEDTLISTHTDSLMMLNILGLGLKELIFPYPIFHQEHERRFDFGKISNEMHAMYAKLQKIGKKVLAENKPHITNDEDWGLKNYELETKLF